MNKTKKITILCVAIVAILAITISVSFAFWDKTSSAFDFDTVNAAGSVELKAKAVGSYDNTHKLMPPGALINTSKETKTLKIGGFHTNLVDPAGVESTEADIAARVKIQYSVKSFKVGDNDLTGTYSNLFKIIVNTDSTDSSKGVLSNAVVANDVDYFVWIEFVSTVKADDVVGYKDANISVKFTLKAENIK